MPKYVVSATLENPEWNNTQVLRGDPVEQIRKLRHETDGNLVVHGSGQLARTLIDSDLVDELRLMIFPVILGDGKRPFGSNDQPKRLQLAETKPVGPDDVLVLTYRPASQA